MDIKLKDNNISYNNFAFLMSIVIVLLPAGKIFFDYNFSDFMGSVYSMTAIVIIIIAFVKIEQNKDVVFKDNIITLLFESFYLEVKIAFAVVFFFLFKCLYEEYDGEFFIFDGELAIITVILIILIYAFCCDIHKINRLSHECRISEYIKNKSIIHFLKVNSSLYSLFFIIILVAVLIFNVICIIAFEDIYYTYFGRGIINLAQVVCSITIIYTLFLQYECIKIAKITENSAHMKGKATERKNKTILLKDIEDNINNMDNRLNKAVEEAVKSERMKSELITNVSHDLKTPLTSIINYVDLLDKDNLTKEDQKRYVGFLKDRSARLKLLIEDLMEASKAASGNVELKIEQIELNSLMRQTLGEYEDRIVKSQLNFIINIPEEKIYVDGDGRRLFRVFANLITNILKYSFENSRVYIDMYEEESKVYIVFKNISKYILNVKEDELLEKFKRGDASRSTEGNGLGLAIAKSLVELHHGKFEIKVDGDLFKATVVLNKN